MADLDHRVRVDIFPKEYYKWNNLPLFLKVDTNIVRLLFIWNELDVAFFKLM